MSEQMLAVTRFERQLHAAGIAESIAIPTVFLYIAALQDGTRATWESFYRSVHERLRELAELPYPRVGRGAKPLLDLLDDDLGSELISTHERARIRGRLVEDASREASLPS